MGDDAHEAEERATTLALKWGLDAYGKASVQREILWARQEARAEVVALVKAARRGERELNELGYDHLSWELSAALAPFKEIE